jgi:hypothetical protein
MCKKASIIGPSGVRALPLAAGINEGGHYFRYCQSQSQIQLSWAELALSSKNPASVRPAARPPWASTRAASKEAEILDASFFQPY